MSRIWHILKGNARSETAHNVIFFDTETRAERQPDGSERDYLTFGWLCAVSRTSKGFWGQQRWHRFHTVPGFWRIVDTLVRPKSKWFLFCHNTSYDLPVLDIFGASVRNGWKLEGAVIEAPPTIITFKRGGTTLQFLDTLNWWRMPLAKLGERLGIAKLKMPDKRAPRKVWDEYCKRDVEVLRVTVFAWFDFLQANDLGGFASTLAGQAFRSFRHRFMKHDIVIDCDDRGLALSREAYHGGRVECFKLGKHDGPIYGYDFNSMYLDVMRDNYFPVKLLGVYPTQAPDRWERLCDEYCIVARCVITTTAPCYPVHTRNGLCFPTGDFECTLTTPEIKLALERGDLRDMGQIVVYERQDIFSEFSNFIWGERQRCELEGDGVGNFLFKTLGNSLYGKFGQTGQVYESQDQIADLRAMKFTIVDADTGKVFKCRQLGGLLQVMSSAGEGRDSFPAIAAHVTSFSRVKLWRAAQAAGLPNVLYCDTDSLYVTESGAAGLRHLVDPSRLGALKAVGIYPWMILHGLKDYELPGHTVRKGIRADAVQEGPVTFRQTQWSSLKGLVGGGDVTAPQRKQIVKVLKREYRKGRPL